MPSLTASHSSLEFSQSSWRNIFINRQYQSFIIFLSDCNWSKYKAELDVPDFHDTLEAFQDYNSSVINKEGLDLATAGCDVSIKQNYKILVAEFTLRWRVTVILELLLGRSKGQELPKSLDSRRKQLFNFKFNLGLGKEKGYTHRVEC